ncbi:MAG TPA: cation-translocating P-type ATPase [Longimicrobiales bacterium]
MAIPERRNQARPREDAPPWFVLPAGEVLRRLDVDAARGLSSADARARLARYGRNELLRAEGPGPWRILWNQFWSPLIVVLIVAAAISTVTWFFQTPREPLPYDALVILAIVVLNAVLGFVQEYRAERAVEALKRMTAPEARVRRDGGERQIPAADLVPGDVMLLETGDRVPADGRLLKVTSLKADEAPLTGESVAVSKRVEALDDPGTELGDRANMVFMGTSVAYGRGEAVVVATGMATEMGGIATLLGRAEEKTTPLQRQLARVGRQLGVVALSISLVVVVAGTLRAGSFSPDVLLRMFLFGVALAVAAVPEGLPAVVTASLALGVRRLAQRNAIVRRLPAVETLGSADVICTDKTGTITRGEMTVRRILLGENREIHVTGEGYAPEGEFRDAAGDRIAPERDDALLRLLRMAALDNDARLEVEGEGDARRWTIDGDPTEGALVVAAHKAGIDARRLREDVPRVGEIPFSGERKRMTTVHVLDGVRTAVVKGAPEVVMERCALVRDGPRGRPLDDATRAAILRRNERFAAEALRTLAFASRPLPADVAVDDADAIERDLVFEGIVGMLDPPRREAAPAVAQAGQAGIRTLLLTGDHVLTARAIAHRVGVAGEDAPVLTGRQIAAMGERELERRVEDVSVYGRMGPGEKILILRALKARRRIVAMTGDGVNDAPAVKDADIGVAMGISGTDVTREASDVILLDDNFATIVAAIAEGRRVFDNIRSFTRYLLSANAGEVLTVFAAVLLAGALGLAPGGALFLPLLPAQILWINLVTDGPPALALGMSPADPAQMRRPPRPPREPVIHRPMWILIGTVGVVIMSGMLLVLDAYLPGGLFRFMGPGGDPGAEIRYARTAAFTTLLMFELFDVFNCLSQTESILHSRVHRHPWLLGAVALSLGLQVAVVYWPPLQPAFDTVPLAPVDWLFATGVAASVIVAVEVLKRTPLVRSGPAG